MQSDVASAETAAWDGRDARGIGTYPAFVREGMVTPSPFEAGTPEHLASVR
jgi:hypothetical protein